jgi:hypothetical protein
MVTIMEKDISRRFVFALTMEDNNARIWLHNRADTVKSVKFNIDEVSY